MISTNMAPSTISHRSVYKLTACSSAMIRNAPTTDPNSVPMPPTIAIRSPATDWDNWTVEGLTKLLKIAYMAPAVPAKKPETVNAITR